MLLGLLGPLEVCVIFAALLCVCWLHFGEDKTKIKRREQYIKNMNRHIVILEGEFSNIIEHILCVQ